MSPQTKVDHDPLPSDRIVRVQIGDVCCSLKCNDGDVISSWQQQYVNFLSDKPADISVVIEWVDTLSFTEIKEAISEAVFRHKNNHFTTSNKIITGEYDLGGPAISIRAEKGLLHPDLDFNAMNRLFALAYFTACKVRYGGDPPAFLVHSCGIVRHGQVLLFAGPCDAGKTTIARLCGEQYGRVLNDEMVLISRPHRGNSALTAQGVPILGEFPQRLNEAAPLACVLLLKQSKRTAVRRLERTEAYVRFIRQVISPAYIGQSDRRAVYSLIAEFSDEVTRTTPFYELEFALNKELLWEVVEELEKSLEKENEHDGKSDNQSRGYHLAADRR